MWKNMKWVIINSIREVNGLRVKEKNPKNMEQSMVKVAVEGKDVVWKEALGTSNENAKERYMEVYKE